MSPTATTPQKTPKARFAERYEREIAPQLMKAMKVDNRYAVPKLVKIVINIGCGEAAHDAKVLEEAQRDLGLITGQKPLITRAKTAISNFKIKEGDPVGCKVTLRKQRMYEFLDRLISVVLPRIRDFRGVSANGFDRSGNYNFGLSDLTIFPELKLDDVHYAQGMDIAMITTANTPADARTLLAGFGMPFEKA